jgi:phosphoribosylformylglycinamidine synthase
VANFLSKINNMKFGVVVFPGSNCDKDMLHVLGNVMGCEVREIWHKETSLADFSKRDCIILPGGFSYGDYLRTGAIARFSPIMEAVIEFAKEGGKVLGICNGFQILCESGLLPGALLRNTNMKYNCKNIYLKAQTQNTLLTQFIKPTAILKIPIAHGEGRYYADAETLKQLKSKDQILFRYCDANGNINDSANPNGSLENIAGICNEGRNVFGMMPHPERASEEELGNSDGRILFESLIGKILETA